MKSKITIDIVDGPKGKAVQLQAVIVGLKDAIMMLDGVKKAEAKLTASIEQILKSSCTDCENCTDKTTCKQKSNIPTYVQDLMDLMTKENR